MFIAENLSLFKKLFADHLKNMLSADELGAFILVLANSHQDADLRSALAEVLKENFSMLKLQYELGVLKATDDDLAVFQQLLETDLNDLSIWQTRQIGDWEISYNAMRALRPARSSSEVLTSIKVGFDNKRFHFNKPFLKPEVLWEGEYENVLLRVLYNKFPFSPYHLLLAVGPETGQSQYLTAETHYYISALVEKNQQALPGLSMGFNSLAAGASVNHLHFQGFVRAAQFPIENSKWRHNGGEYDYPVAVSVSDSAEECWQWIESLNTADQAYNILYRASRFYLITRAFQGTVDLPGWLQGCGWLDMAGVMTVSDYDEFETLTADDISSGLSLLRV